MDFDKRMMANISYLYYEQDMTQQEISQQMGLSRMKISRLLKQAKDCGIVKITIDYSGSFLELENGIKEKYNLKSVIIVDGSDVLNSRQKVAAAAAHFLENNLVEGNTVAVGWGTTLAKIPDFLHKNRNKRILFSPIIGGHGNNELIIHASSITSRLARETGCESLFLLSPAFAQTAEERDALLNDRFIKEVLSRSASADYALFSLGNPLAQNSSIALSGYFTKEEIDHLHHEKATCDVVSVLFLNEECSPCCEEISRRSIGIKAEELKKIPLKICVVDGVSKYLPVKVALKASLIDILVLDDGMARYLLNHAA